MRTNLISLFALLIIGIQSLTAQSYYKNYQDGLVVFQLKQDQKRILSKDKKVDFEKYPIFTSYLKEYNIEGVKQLHPNIDNNKLNRTYQIRLSDFSKVDLVARKLSQNPKIEYAELKALHYSQMTPNDTYYSSNQWFLPHINSEDAWDMSTGSSNVTVAVTDNSVYTNHEDLQNHMLTGYDADSGNSDPSPCGSNAGDHGTHVSGIIGAETNNNTGVASIGAGVSILPIKVGDCSDDALPYGYDGVVWAANNGADIINMSWGGPGGGQYGQNVIDDAWNNGCILVAASGNDGVSSKFYPAGYNNVIAVAATDQNDNLANFSNYGSWIDISAPGVDIVSTVNPNGNYGGSYASMQGTSMASPLVSGLLGLMESYAPSASRSDIINCLYSTAVNIESNAGNGRIDAHAALQCLSSFNVDYDAAITKIINPNGSLCASTITPEIELKNQGAETLTSATITYDWGGSPQTYNWSGNLTTGQSETITLSTETLSDGSYTFSATVSSPNGNTDENNSNNNATSNFSINGSGEEVVLDLQTDCYGTDITWEITSDDDNSVVASGGPYSDITGGTNDVRSICLSSGCYTFTISDSYGDGLSGSQYQGCSTDGDFNMKDANNNILFEMDAQDGNFGNSETHQFCINNDIDDDAGITKINSPEGVVCSANITPEVVLKNFGTNNLTAVTIKYQTSGGWQNYSWTGSLASSQTTTVTLPSIAIANGQQTITVKTDQPNGNADGNTSNDEAIEEVNVQSSSASLPFIEDFEGGSNDWSVVNPDNAITWTYETVGGITPGNTAAKIDFYNYQQSGRRDGLISPKIDLTGVTSAQMNFDHAYRRYNQSAADSLIVYVSTDCGSSWNRIIGWAEDGSGSFATQTTTTTEFTPTTAKDWCFEPISQQTPGAGCFTVDLDAFTGNDVFVKFESYNAGNTGNNLFIDNINIDGQTQGNPPIPNMSQDLAQICEGETVNYTDQSSNNPTSWNWTFSGGSPATSNNQNPTVVYNTSGTYDVTLEVTNADGTNTETFTNTIVVDAPPQVNPSVSESEICKGESTTVSVSGDANSYNWNHGLGNGTSFTVSPLMGTTYTVTGTKGSCETIADIEVTVNSTPTVSINASQTEICKGSNVNLTASGANNYSWDHGLGNGSSQTVSPTSTTTYEVTGSNGNCTDQESITIEVNEEPTVQVTVTESEICEGESTTITASGADDYSWSPGTGLNTTSGATVVASPNSTENYSVTGSNSCGLSTETISVVVNPLPNPTITQMDNTFSVNLQSGETAEWFVEGSSYGSGSSITIPQTGTYNVEVVVSSSNGCEASTNDTFEIETSSLSKEDDINTHLSIYPNPTKDAVKITLDNKNKLENVKVFDALGQQVLDFNAIKKNELSINLKSFDSGVYILKVYTKDYTMTRRVIKK